MRKRLCGLLVCFVLWPGVAHATFWGFLQELSGPGPFQGPGVALRVLCVQDPPLPRFTTCLRDRNPDDYRQILNLQVALQVSGDGERFDDVVGDTGRVWAFRLEPTYQFRVHPAFDVGAGAGLLRLAGRGFDPLYRLSLTPVSVTFTPGVLGGSRSPAARFLKIRFDELYLPKGFSGPDFGDLATAFRTDREWLSSVSVVFDVFLPFR